MPANNSRQRFSTLIFPAGALVALLFAYILDSWLLTQMNIAQDQGSSSPIFIWEAVSGLVLFAAWLILAWIAVAKSRRSILVSIIALIVGFLLFNYAYLYMTFLWVPFILYRSGSPVAYTGLVIAVLCLLQWLVPGKADNG